MTFPPLSSRDVGRRTCNINSTGRVSSVQLHFFTLDPSAFFFIRTQAKLLRDKVGKRITNNCAYFIQRRSASRAAVFCPSREKQTKQALGGYTFVKFSVTIVPLQVLYGDSLQYNSGLRISAESSFGMPKEGHSYFRALFHWVKSASG